MRQDTPDSVMGKAKVEIHSESRRSTITIEVGEEMTAFLEMGTLRGFDLNASISDVDREKAKAWRSKQR